MANLASVLPVPAVGQSTTSVRDLARLRLSIGLGMLLISLVGLLGGDWDIQWHAVIGRDRTFTPPHDMILIGIGLAGVTALANILIETRRVGRHPELRRYSTDFLGVLHSSLGSYLTGFGAVCSAIAFPLDTYWHSLYGIDVSLWAPFHTMIYMGSVLSTFGIVYLLLSSAHLAHEQQDRATAAWSYAGVAMALGILLSKFDTFLTPAISQHTLRVGNVTITLFPFLMALAAVFVCVLAVRLLPWTGAATLVVAVFLVLWLLVGAFVPPMMTLLVQIEHQTYLARASRIGTTIVPLIGQTPILLLLSFGIDAVVWLGRRNHWANTMLNTRVLVAAMISMFFVAAATLASLGMRLRATHGGGGVMRVALELLLVLILTIPGSLIGNWASGAISNSLQTLRR